MYLRAVIATTLLCFAFASSHAAAGELVQLVLSIKSKAAKNVGLANGGRYFSAEQFHTLTTAEAEEWIQVATVVIEAGELRSSRGQSRLGEFLLELHSRYLGCRFGYDEDHALTIMTDVYPENIRAKHIVAVMRQLDYIATVTVPLIRRVLEFGKVPPDSDVDAAFASGESDA